MRRAATRGNAREADKAIEGAGGMHEASAPARRSQKPTRPAPIPDRNAKRWPFQ